jgi:hypothetical protein
MNCFKAPECLEVGVARRNIPDMFERRATPASKHFHLGSRRPDAITEARPMRNWTVLTQAVYFKTCAAESEVSTTCVSRWIQESTPVDRLTHPLTQVVLT